MNIQSRIEQVNNEIIASTDYNSIANGDVKETNEMVDIYQRDVNKRCDEAKTSRPNGASQILAMAVRSVIDGDGGEGLARAAKRARDDSESLKKRGERERAEMRRQQYMNEYFLPAVEIVVNSTTPDELLNSKTALNKLDEYAMLEGSGKGYTASYVRSAYGDQLGQVEGRSDPYVQSQMRELNRALDNGNIRLGYSIASKLRDKVDKGEHMMDDIDYDMVGRIISYYG